MLALLPESYPWPGLPADRYAPLASMREDVQKSSMASCLLGFLLKKNPRHMTWLSLRWLKYLARDKDCVGHCGTSPSNVCLCSVGTSVGV